MFFKDQKIYSYGYHYLAAEIYRVKNEDVVLINSSRVSNTTAKHLSEIRSASIHLKQLQTKYVSDPIKSLKEEHANLAEEYFDFFNAKPTKWIEWYEWKELWNNFEDDVSSFNKFCDLFDRVSLKINLTELQETLWREKFHELKDKRAERNTPEAIAKRISARAKATEKKEKALKEKLSKEIQNWRMGSPAGSNLRYLRPQILRIKEGRLETSGGASVPMNEAYDLLRKIRTKKARKGSKVGQFKLDRIENEQVIIGCHCIDLKEAMEVLMPITQLSLIQGGVK